MYTVSVNVLDETAATKTVVEKFILPLKTFVPPLLFFFLSQRKFYCSDRLVEEWSDDRATGGVRIVEERVEIR